MTNALCVVVIVVVFVAFIALQLIAVNSGKSFSPLALCHNSHSGSLLEYQCNWMQLTQFNAVEYKFKLPIYIV